MKEEIKNIIKKVSEESAASQKRPEQLVQLVVFELDQEEYAVEITDLREIIRFPLITAIPNAPQFISGIFNLRGKIVVTVDMEQRFQLVREKATQPKHIIITEVNGNTYGVIVDQVTEVLRVPGATLQSAPELVSSKIHADYLKGVVVLENEKRSRLIILLDLPKLLQEKELLSFGKIVNNVQKKYEQN